LILKPYFISLRENAHYVRLAALRDRSLAPCIRSLQYACKCVYYSNTYNWLGVVRFRAQSWTSLPGITPTPRSSYSTVLYAISGWLFSPLRWQSQMFFRSG